VCARQSEGVIMALKYGVPLNVSKQVISQSLAFYASNQIFFDDSDKRRLVDLLENLDSKELVKHPMQT
jgi:bifunctional DNase/RNase